MPDFQATITLQDAYDRRTTKRFEGSFLDFAAAQTALVLLVADIDGLSDAEVIGYSAGQKSDYSGSLVAGANLDAGITLSVQKTDNEKAVLKVPAPAAAVINADGTVDVTNALVTDYVDNWITGTWYISDGDEVDSLLSGKLDR
jgi:maleate cis-trans isomerase